MEMDGGLVDGSVVPRRLGPDVLQRDIGGEELALAEIETERADLCIGVQRGFELSDEPLLEPDNPEGKVSGDGGEDDERNDDKGRCA